MPKIISKKVSLVSLPGILIIKFDRFIDIYVHYGILIVVKYIPNIGYCKNLNEKNPNKEDNNNNMAINNLNMDNIIDILPMYFDPNEKNKKFVKSQAAKDLIAHMKPKLRDLQFEAFYNEFKYKNKYMFMYILIYLFCHYNHLFL